MHEHERNPINGSTAIPDDRQQTISDVIEQGSTDEEQMFTSQMVDNS
jgi:hypothetical protein